MLRNLHVKNLALIDEAEVDFEKGLNILTGETGAGKSIGPEDEITIEVGMRRSQRDEQVEVSFDGDSGVELKVGDKIVVHKAEESVGIIRLSKISFLEILRKKMQNYT